MQTKENMAGLLSGTNPGSPDAMLGGHTSAELLGELKRRRDEGALRFDSVEYVHEEENPYDNNTQS